MYVFFPSPISIHSHHSSSLFHRPIARVHLTASSKGRCTVLALSRVCTSMHDGQNMELFSSAREVGFAATRLLALGGGLHQVQGPVRSVSFGGEARCCYQ